MMKPTVKRVLLLALCLVMVCGLFTDCKKETEEVNTVHEVRQYLPLRLRQYLPLRLRRKGVAHCGKEEGVQLCFVPIAETGLTTARNSAPLAVRKRIRPERRRSSRNGSNRHTDSPSISSLRTNRPISKRRAK